MSTQAELDQGAYMWTAFAHDPENALGKEFDWITRPWRYQCIFTLDAEALDGRVQVATKHRISGIC